MRNHSYLALALAAAACGVFPARRDTGPTDIDDMQIGPTGIEWKPGRGPKPTPKTKRHAGDAKKARRKNQQKGRRAARGK